MARKREFMSAAATTAAPIAPPSPTIAIAANCAEPGEDDRRHDDRGDLGQSRVLGDDAEGDRRSSAGDREREAGAHAREQPGAPDADTLGRRSWERFVEHPTEASRGAMELRAASPRPHPEPDRDAALDAARSRGTPRAARAGSAASAGRVDEVVRRLAAADAIDLVLHAQRADELERLSEDRRVLGVERAALGGGAQALAPSTRPSRRRTAPPSARGRRPGPTPDSLMSSTPRRRPPRSRTRSRRKPVGGLRPERHDRQAAQRRLARPASARRPRASRSASAACPVTVAPSTATASSVRPRSRSGSASQPSAARSHASTDRANSRLDATAPSGHGADAGGGHPGDDALRDRAQRRRRPPGRPGPPRRSRCRRRTPGTARAARTSPARSTRTAPAPGRDPPATSSTRRRTSVSWIEAMTRWIVTRVGARVVQRDDRRRQPRRGSRGARHVARAARSARAAGTARGARRP